MPEPGPADCHGRLAVVEVCTLAATYHEVTSAADQLTRTLSGHERDMAFRGTASRFYRLHVGRDAM
jgi:hypothetical protein